MSEKLELEVKPEVLTKEVEKELMANKKIEEKTVENSLNYAMLAPEEQKAIDEFVEKVNVEDTTQILQYGASAQTKISKFSDSVLENVKTKNAGEVGDLLSSLVVEIKDFDTSVGGEPMIVDYEKSIVEFANENPDGFNQIKDNIRILYPEPTIWNSHCVATFTEAGNEYYKAIQDKEISQIAWEKYGFRTGVTGGNYNVDSLGIKGMPSNIRSTVSSLKMNMYDNLISFLKGSN